MLIGQQKIKKWVLWCFLNVIGGEGSAKNGQNKTSINIIIERKSSYATPSFPANYWIEKVTQKYGPNAIFHAIKMNDFSLLEILIENGYNVEIENENLEKPIHLAARNGRTECLKILIENGTNCYSKDSEGRTLLHEASRTGNTECLKILLENNADSSAKNNDGNTPLHEAARNGRTECLKILLENNADSNVKRYTSASGGKKWRNRMS